MFFAQWCCGWVWDLVNVQGSPPIFFGWPLVYSQGAPGEKNKRGRCHGTFFWNCLRFSSRVLENVFMVFLGSSCRETAKNAIEKNRREKTTGNVFLFSTFLAKRFWHGVYPKGKSFFWCFLNPLVEKRTNNIYKSTMGPHLVAICQIYVAFNKKVFGAPCI